jgi:predicted rRNA methylase YqxC with S4 and FtsJ domains
MKFKYNSEESTRLDTYLVMMFPEYSRSQIQKFIKQGMIQVNKKVVYKPNTTMLDGYDIESNIIIETNQEITS